MHLNNQQLNQLSELALEAVTLAADYINNVDKSQLTTHYKNSGASLSAQVVTEVDLACQEIIIKQLHKSCADYDIALLSEENCSEIAINKHPRLSQDYFWCVDPLDGTLPFIEGRDGYAVSVALVDKIGQAIIGATCQPTPKITYQTKIDTHGKTVVYKNKKLVEFIPQLEHQTLSVYVDQSFLNSASYTPLLKKLRDALPALGLQTLKVISGNGAVINALSVFENSAAVYIKLPKKQQGGGALWDFSATVAISQGLNGWVSDIHGAPLKLNQAESYYMNEKGVIYASNEQLARQVVLLCNALLME